MITTQEMLEEVEGLLQLDHRNRALKAVAADLRARIDSAPSVAMFELCRRLSVLHVRQQERRIPRGEIVNAKVGVAEELVARWPVVKAALEKFGAEVEKLDHAEKENIGWPG